MRVSRFALLTRISIEDGALPLDRPFPLDCRGVLRRARVTVLFTALMRNLLVVVAKFFWLTPGSMQLGIARSHQAGSAPVSNRLPGRKMAGRRWVTS